MGVLHQDLPFPVAHPCGLKIYWPHPPVETPGERIIGGRAALVRREHRAVSPEHRAVWSPTGHINRLQRCRAGVPKDRIRKEALLANRTGGRLYSVTMFYPQKRTDWWVTSFTMFYQQKAQDWWATNYTVAPKKPKEKHRTGDSKLIKLPVSWKPTSLARSLAGSEHLSALRRRHGSLRRAASGAPGGRKSSVGLRAGVWSGTNVSVSVSARWPPTLGLGPNSLNPTRWPLTYYFLVSQAL